MGAGNATNIYSGTRAEDGDVANTTDHTRRHPTAPQNAPRTSTTKDRRGTAQARKKSRDSRCDTHRNVCPKYGRTHHQRRCQYAYPRPLEKPTCSPKIQRGALTTESTHRLRPTHHTQSIAQ
ncbi:MAG TPA: hypothetical protein DCE42_23540, partial [Myxococcales bacterium]|nr:hypothetical protein [Myxococcales bacterium]